jgi:gamma-glutamylcyclotransferase (GGCT)/AIG2-like uncharacterized protein YtfP
MKEPLFSYGTLQLKKVQIESFGRKLNGTKERLKSFKIEQLKITDPLVLLKSEKEFHPIAIPTNDEKDEINGTLYKISLQELKKADDYEVSDYVRIKATFESGKKGWIYIKS